MTYRPWQRPAIRKAAIVVGLLILWEVVTRLGDVSPLLFPPASTVVVSFLRSIASGEVPGYAGQSLRVLLTGMAIGGAIALVLTSLAVTTRLGAEFLQTVTAMFNPLPAIALMPLALLWFGLGVKSLIFVIIHSVLWPMSLNTYTGFVTVPPTLRRVGQNFGLSGWRLVAGILLPAAFPHILTGIKIGWAFAWRTIIAAEMVFGVAGSQGGLGWFIYQNRFEMNTDLVFAGLLTVILIGLLVENLFFRWLERKTVLRWGMSAGALLLAMLGTAPAVEAQQAAKAPRIGVLSPQASTESPTIQREPFERGLRELGWTPGSTIVIEYRYAEGDSKRMSELAKELVTVKVDVIVARGPAVEAAREATSTIPIVMSAHPDPLGRGLVPSLARPGGNITGLSFLAGGSLVGKHLELLKETVPGVARVAVLENVRDPEKLDRRAIDAAARALGLAAEIFAVARASELEETFTAIGRARVGALLVRADPLILEPNRARVTALALKHRLPTMYPWRIYVDAGGLMSYATSIPGFHRRSATYVDKILKGAKPGDLPVEQATTFELVVNLKAAQALGLAIPHSILLRADEVIR